MTKRSQGCTTKAERREKSKARYQRNATLPGDHLDVSRPTTRHSRRPLEPKTEAQAAYINAIQTYDLIFCKGPAGTGKTYVAAAAAAEAFEGREIKKIIITRPAVAAEEDYGYFPGDLMEKIAPWAKPVIAILEQRLGAGAVEYMLKSEQIEIAPLGMLRGHTFENAFIIFDEAQNATVSQMKLFLTRIGENVKVIVDGDPDEQTDIKGESGFMDAWDRMRGHRQIGFVSFTIDDIVRSGLCRDILLRYRKEATVGHAELGNFLDNGSR